MDGFIQTNTSRMRPNGKGRPRIDDGDQIIDHFVRGLRDGRTVAAVARGGLVLVGYESGPGNRPQRVIRRLSGATLERRYRGLKAFIDAELANRQLWNPALGMRVPEGPNGFATPVVLKRGRPRKRAGIK